MAFAEALDPWQVERPFVNHRGMKLEIASLPGRCLLMEKYKRGIKRFYVVVCVAGTALTSVLAMMGCGQQGPPLAIVTGKVTLDGNPVSNAIVTFAPVNGGMASTGVTEADGTYRLRCNLGEGALIGQHRVSIRSQPPVSDLVGSGADFEDNPNVQPDPDARFRLPVFVDPIPARYNDNTELVREVKPGKNVIDFELTSKP